MLYWNIFYFYEALYYRQNINENLAGDLVKIGTNSEEIY